MPSEKKAYVYLHKRNDGSVFYVGKGVGCRSTSLSGRNVHWKRTVEKNGGFDVEIIRSGLTDQEAYDLEIATIQHYRSSGVRLCNIFNGGEGGNSGGKLSDEHKDKLRNAKIGRKQNPEHARKSALAKLGKKQPAHAHEITMQHRRRPVIDSDGIIYKSATDAARAISAQQSIKASQGNISTAARGERACAYGKSWSYDISKIPEFVTHVGARKKRIQCSNGMIFDSALDAVLWIVNTQDKPIAVRQSISACARGECQSAYGYTWSYIT